MLDRKKILKSWLPVALWMAVIFMLSSVPGEAMPKISLPNFNSFAHFLEYCILGVLFIRAAMNSNIKLSLPKLAVLSIFLIALFAISDEWHQYFVPGRMTDLVDFLFDSLGSMVGVLLYSFKTLRIKNPS